MKKFFINVLSTGNNESISHKRLIGLLGFLFLTASMFISVVSKRTLTPSPDLIEAVKYITVAALFGNTLEKFAYRNNQPPTPPNTNNQTKQSTPDPDC